MYKTDEERQAARRKQKAANERVRRAVKREGLAKIDFKPKPKDICLDWLTKPMR